MYSNGEMEDSKVKGLLLLLPLIISSVSRVNYTFGYSCSLFDPCEF